VRKKINRREASGGLHIGNISKELVNADVKKRKETFAQKEHLKRRKGKKKKKKEGK